MLIFIAYFAFESDLILCTMLCEDILGKIMKKINIFSMSTVEVWNLAFPNIINIPKESKQLIQCKCMADLCCKTRELHLFLDLDNTGIILN